MNSLPKWHGAKRSSTSRARSYGRARFSVLPVPHLGEHVHRLVYNRLYSILLVQKQNTKLNIYSNVNARGTVLEVGAVAPEGGILGAEACHTHHNNNQGVKEEHIQGTLREPHQCLPGVNNSRIGKACIQAAALVDRAESGIEGALQKEVPSGQLLLEEQRLQCLQEVSVVGLMEVEAVEGALVHLKLEKKLNKK